MSGHWGAWQWKAKATEVGDWVRGGTANLAPATVATKTRRPARVRKGW
jgi:hypothetical protein